VAIKHGTRSQAAACLTLGSTGQSPPRGTLTRRRLLPQVVNLPLSRLPFYSTTAIPLDISRGTGGPTSLSFQPPSFKFFL